MELANLLNFAAPPISEAKVMGDFFGRRGIGSLEGDTSGLTAAPPISEAKVMGDFFGNGKKRRELILWREIRVGWRTDIFTLKVFQCHSYEDVKEAGQSYFRTFEVTKYTTFSETTYYDYLLRTLGPGYIPFLVHWSRGMKWAAQNQNLTPSARKYAIHIHRSLFISVFYFIYFFFFRLQIIHVWCIWLIGFQ